MDLSRKVGGFRFSQKPIAFDICVVFGFPKNKLFIMTVPSSDIASETGWRKNENIAHRIVHGFGR